VYGNASESRMLLTRDADAREKAAVVDTLNGIWEGTIEWEGIPEPVTVSFFLHHEGKDVTVNLSPPFDTSGEILEFEDGIYENDTIHFEMRFGLVMVDCIIDAPDSMSVSITGLKIPIEFTMERKMWSEGIFKGVRTEWYENGQKAAAGTVKNDLKDGAWTLWYENGQKWLERIYENGQKQSEGSYEDDILVEGVAFLWQEPNITNSYDKHQPKSERIFKNGRLVEEIMFEWHWQTEGGLSREEHILDDGTSFVTEWYVNGQKRYESTNDGDGTGVRNEWHEGGQKRSEAIFKNGKYEAYTEWYENGQKKSDRHLLEHAENGGIYTMWHENGKKMEEREYKNGVLEMTKWDERGKVTWKYPRQDG